MNKTNSFAIQDNMEMLELALKQSIDWSVKRGDSRKGVAAAAVDCANRRLSHDSLDIMKLRLRNESHARAFISQFKIELNNLMGMKCSLLNESCLSSSTDDTNDEIDDGETDADETTPSEDPGDQDEASLGQTTKMRRSSSVQSSTLLRRTAGLYDIREHQTDTDENDDTGLHGDDSSSQRTAKTGNSSSNVTTCEEDTDFGYGSLNRAENNMAHNGVIQELNEIKSRLIDLVEEIDMQAKAHLSQDELDCYRRRRDALVCKLDSLVERLGFMKNGSALIQGSSGSQHNMRPVAARVMNQRIVRSASLHKPSARTKKLALRNRYSSTAGEYEEQVHVIDYTGFGCGNKDYQKVVETMSKQPENTTAACGISSSGSAKSDNVAWVDNAASGAHQMAGDILLQNHTLTSSSISTSSSRTSGSSSSFL